MKFTLTSIHTIARANVCQSPSIAGIERVKVEQWLLLGEVSNFPPFRSFIFLFPFFSLAETRRRKNCDRNVFRSHQQINDKEIARGFYAFYSEKWWAKKKLVKWCKSGNVRILLLWAVRTSCFAHCERWDLIFTDLRTW